MKISRDELHGESWLSLQWIMTSPEVIDIRLTLIERGDAWDVDKLITGKHTKMLHNVFLNVTCVFSSVKIL